MGDEEISVIFLKDVVKSYGHGRRAVDGVSLSLDKGEIGCLIGRSGCGKTSVLKMINRLVEPCSGLIQVANQSSHSCSAVSWRRKMGYVVQKSGLLPHMTVSQNMSLLAKIMKQDQSEMEKRVIQLLGMVDLDYEEFAFRYPSQLSGGQQQRVGIARALMLDPDVLLMDEPFGALDPISRKSLHQHIIDLNNHLNKTILIVTHDLQEAFFLSNKVMLMHNGKIVQTGTKDDFLKRPANQFVKDFVGMAGHV